MLNVAVSQQRTSDEEHNLEKHICYGAILFLNNVSKVIKVVSTCTKVENEHVLNNKATHSILSS